MDARARRSRPNTSTALPPAIASAATAPGGDPAALEEPDITAARIHAVWLLADTAGMGGENQPQVCAGRPERCPVRMVVREHMLPTRYREVHAAQTVFAGPFRLG